MKAGAFSEHCEGSLTKLYWCCWWRVRQDGFINNPVVQHQSARTSNCHRINHGACCLPLLPCSSHYLDSYYSAFKQRTSLSTCCWNGLHYNKPANISRVGSFALAFLSCLLFLADLPYPRRFVNRGLYSTLSSKDKRIKGPVGCYHWLSMIQLSSLLVLYCMYIPQ